MSLKKKLTITIIGSVVLACLCIASFVYFQMEQYINLQVEESMIDKVSAIHEVAKSQYRENLTNLEHAIKVAGKDVNNNSAKIDHGHTTEVTMINQITKEKKHKKIPMFLINENPTLMKYNLVDEIAHNTNSAVTIFQLVEEGLLRISTNIKKLDGNRATGTFIPTDSPVYQKIVSGEDFYGRAYVVNEWYVTIYRPLMENGKVIGAIFVGKAESNLKTLKHEVRSKKIGKTGYAYIANYDGVLVAHKSIEGQNIFNLKDADGKFFYQEMVKNKNGIIHYNWIDPETKKSSIKTVAYKSFDEMNWILAAGMNKEEIYEPLTNLQKSLFLITISVIIVCAGISFFLQQRISAPLIKVASILTNVSDKIDDSANQVLSGSNGLREATGTQASSLMQTTESLNFIRASIEKSNSSIEHSVNSGKASMKAANSGMSAVNNMLAAMDEIQAKNSEVFQKIDESHEKMNEITQVISEIAEKANVINDIVFQTKLLSFNASVEAARAGEHGKGFSIVAEEVGNLANMSGASALEIQNLLSEGIAKVEEHIRENKIEMAAITKEAQEKIQLGVQTAKTCENELKSISKNIKDSTDVSFSVMEDSKSQFASINEINQAVVSLNDITSKNVEISDRTNERAEDLQTNASTLKEATDEVLHAIYGQAS